jgi:serine/threonine protein kinase
MNTGSLAPQLRDLGGPSPALRSRVEREFDLLRRLDRPGPGESWLAVRGRDQQRAVVRIIPREAVREDQAAALEDDLLRALRLAPHPNLAPVLAVDGAGEQLAFAAASAEGDDLESLVKQTGPLPSDAAAECLRQALQGLRRLHEQRLAHGNLTAANLVLDHDGVLKIANLGCAGLSCAEDFASVAARDLRSLAAVLKWLLCGEAASHLGRNGNSSHGAAGADSPGGEVPEPISVLFRRLAAAGGPQGFTSAAEALAFLEAPALLGGEPVPDCGRQECDGSPPGGIAAANVAELPALEITGPAVAASPRTQAWLYGSIALTVAMLLALVSYLLWR